MELKEMLELAALAAGYEKSKLWYVDGVLCWNGLCMHPWCPHTDDGDSRRLEVALYLVVEVLEGETCVSMSLNAPNYLDCCATVAHDGDPAAATRMAVLRCAAEIGKSMKGKTK